MKALHKVFNIVAMSSSQVQLKAELITKFTA